MIRSASGKNSIWLLSAILTAGFITACQPPAATESLTGSDNNITSDNSEVADTPIVISADSVTLAAEYILSIKPSRYQPSLGLQGTIEPIQQARFSASQDLIVQKILVSKGQWVEKGTPLLIVQRQANSDSTDPTLAQNQPSNNNQTIKTDIAPSELTTATPDTGNQNTNIQTDAKNDNKVDTTVGISESEYQASDKTVPSKDMTQLITVRASFSGRVDNVYVTASQQVNARKPLLHMSDDTDLRFIATLPIQAEPQLSVGQNVNFTADNVTGKFSGQVSKLLVSNQSNQLLVYVHVIKNDASRNRLKPNMTVSGRVDYGQIEVGNIMPEQGIHDADLTPLKKPPYQPLMPLTANVWIIKQDQRLTRQPVEVIAYDPDTGQYLIAGINNDSLICLAELPVESAGKKVIIS